MKNDKEISTNHLSVLTLFSRFPIFREFGHNDLKLGLASISLKYKLKNNFCVKCIKSLSVSHYEISKIAYQKEKESSIDAFQGSRIALTVHQKQLQRFSLHLGSHDALKIYFDHILGVNHLTMCALFPKGFETWCQLIGEASLGFSRVWNSGRNHFTCGVHSSRLDQSLTFSYFYSGHQTNFFSVLGFGTHDMEAMMTFQKLFGKASLRFSIYPNSACLSVGTTLKDGLLATILVKHKKGHYNPGLSLEWSK